MGHPALLDEGIPVESNIGLSIEITKPFVRKITLSKQDFFVTLAYLNNVVYSWVYILGSCFDAKNYAYTLTVVFRNGNKSSVYADVNTLDESTVSVISKKTVLMIRLPLIKDNFGTLEKMLIQVTIHALKEEAKDKDEESGVEDESD